MLLNFLHPLLSICQIIIYNTYSPLQQKQVQMPRTWLILLFGYNGQHYYGMQYQKDQKIRSIQKQLITILYSNGFLDTEDYFILGKNHKWGRAARTDKGVHAAMNAVSCLFTIPETFYDESKTLMKGALKETFQQILEKSEIKVHGIKRVVTRFDTRQMVKSRKYHYLCPKYYFVKKEKHDIKDKQQVEEKQKQQNNGCQVLNKLNECCKKFMGTHNFHNYSKGIKAKDQRAQRYVIEFSCQEVIAKAKNEAWVKFTIKGQSFIYHQIRKIIGCIVFVMLNGYDPEFINNTFFNNQMPIPLAPPHGLFLMNLSFDSYNRKKQIPEKIELTEEEENSCEKLREILESHIFETEEGEWKEWYELTLKGIQELTFSDGQKEEEVGVDDN